MNRWNIPASLEREVLARDLACVYCRVNFSLQGTTRGAKPSWEHIVNDARIVTRQNFARCCLSCNASKGAKELRAWLASNYCGRKGITEGAVAQVVREALSSSRSMQSSSPSSGHPSARHFAREPASVIIRFAGQAPFRRRSLS